MTLFVFVTKNEPILNQLKKAKKRKGTGRGRKRKSKMEDSILIFALIRHDWEEIIIGDSDDDDD